MKRYLNIFSAVIAALAVSVSCSLAEVNGYDDGQSRVNIVMDWSQVGDTHPDSMYVLAYHTGKSMVMGYLYPDMVPLHDSVNAEDPMIWHAGEYMLLAFNKRDDIQVSGVDNPRMLCLSLPSYTDSVSRYIADAGEIYVAAGTRSVTAQDETDVTLAPGPLSRSLTVRFSMEVAEDIEVSGVTATLSGLVGSVYPVTGYVNYRDLYETVLSVQLVEAADGVYRYEATSRILGLFPPESEEAVSGKGILYLEVSTTSYRGQRVFSAGINLLNTIEAEAPMEYDVQTQGYVLAQKDIVLDISGVLEISGDGMSGDANDGVDEWFMNGNIDIEL